MRKTGIPAASRMARYGIAVLAAALGLGACASLGVSAANRTFDQAYQQQEEANRLFDQGLYEEAVAKAGQSLQSGQQAVELCSSDPDCELQIDPAVIYSDVYALRALGHLGLEQHKAALEDARAAVAAKKDSPGAHQVLLLALLATGDREAARAELPKARPLTPELEKYLDSLFKLSSAAEAAQALKAHFYERTPFARAMAAYGAEDYALAYELWLPLAKKGSADAQHNLALLYQQGLGVSQSPDKAFEWYLLAAKGGNVPAMEQVGLSYQLGQGVKKNGAEAAKWHQAAAEKGDAAAAFSLGQMYFEGQDVAKSEEAALRWYRQAAEGGVPDGQVMLGYMYEKGLATPADPAKAVEWYRKAAEANSPLGKYNLGVMYANGRGIKKNPEEATRWYKAALDAGYEQAVEALRELAQEDCAPAQYELALLLLEGKRLPQDDRQAVELLARSSERGHPPAQESLGELYLEGKRGLAQDAARGERLLLAAAERDRSGAKLLLARLYHYGKGPVKADPPKAYMWYELVLLDESEEDLPEYLLSMFDLSSGWMDAILGQQMLEQTMTKAQVAEAKRKAALWARQHP